jgi:hypothetical protein
MKILKLLLAVVGLFVAATVLAQAPPAPSPIHPEIAVNLLAWLKGSAVLIMVAVGMIWKFAPFAKNWSNDLIPWVNVVLYILGTLGGVTNALAATGGGQPHNFATNLLLGFLHSGMAKVLWDGWLKPHVDKAFGV